MTFSKRGFSPIVLPRQTGDIPNGALRSIGRAAVGNFRHIVKAGFN